MRDNIWCSHWHNWYSGIHWYKRCYRNCHNTSNIHDYPCMIRNLNSCPSRRADSISCTHSQHSNYWSHMDNYCRRRTHHCCNSENTRSHPYTSRTANNWNCACNNADNRWNLWTSRILRNFVPRNYRSTVHIHWNPYMIQTYTGIGRSNCNIVCIPWSLCIIIIIIIIMTRRWAFRRFLGNIAGIHPRRYNRGWSIFRCFHLLNTPTWFLFLQRRRWWWNQSRFQRQTLHKRGDTTA